MLLEADAPLAGAMLEMADCASLLRLPMKLLTPCTGLFTRPSTSKKALLTRLDTELVSRPEARAVLFAVLERLPSFWLHAHVRSCQRWQLWGPEQQSGMQAHLSLSNTYSTSVVTDLSLPKVMFLEYTSEMFFSSMELMEQDCRHA